MIRFIKELFNPALKCIRRGHLFKSKAIRIRKRSNELREIVADYNAVSSCCIRCDFRKPIEVLDKIEGYNRVGMSNERWDELDSKGFLIITL